MKIQTYVLNSCKYDYTYTHVVHLRTISLSYIYIKHIYDCRDATLITGTGMVMIPLKITIAGKETFFHGVGVNKKQAKCAAAKQALKRLQLEK